MKENPFLNLPKADVHYHLLGGVSLQSMEAFAKKYHANISTDFAKSFYRNYQSKENAQGGIAALKFLYSLLKNASDYEEVVGQVALAAREQNCVYIEAFINSSDIALPYKELLKALENGCLKAASLGVKINICPSINREESALTAQKMVEKVCENPSPFVVGIGMDYRERLGDVKKFIKAYDMARQGGLRLSAHAGEFGVGPSNIRMAIELLGVERIEHGYTVLQDPSLLKYCLKHDLPFSVVPTNTYYHKLYPTYDEWVAKQPIPKMAKAGLRLCPATDDWFIHDTNSTKLYESLVRDLGFKLLDLKDFFKNSVKASFASKELKEELLA